MIFQVFTILVALIVSAIAYYKWQSQYWKRKNLHYLEPKSIFGHFGNPVTNKTSISLRTKTIYNEIKAKKWKHAGITAFFKPAYVALDLDYVKNILTKDFQYFTDRGFYHNERDDPISAHLFALGGAKWKNLRAKLTPTFTSGKMKMMFQTLLECEKGLHEVLEKLHKNHDAIDIKEVFACFTTDIIGSCAFGLDCNSFKEEDSAFRKYGKKSIVISKFRLLMGAFSGSFPEAARFLHVTFNPPDVIEFFMKVVKDTVNYRETHNVSRNDFMQLLIDMKNNKHGSDEKSLTLEEVAAQAFIFFLAGFETSSTTSAFLLYELARHQDIQDRVRKEVLEVLEKHQGNITYEAIQDMKYMNQVIDETLRKYPPLPFITREAVKDYKVPDTDVVIEKGTTAIIPIIGIHYDAEHYPDPEKFDPDRFTEEMKKSRHPYAHIPFGEGPRICIGLRFGIMQTKVGLASLLRNYKFTVNKKTQEPLKMKVNSFIMATEGELWLNAEKI